MKLLMEYQNIFTWSYDEISGLDPRDAVHELIVKNRVKPLK